MESDERDWRSELPFLDWQDGGYLFVDMDEMGRLGYPCRDGSVIAFGTDQRLSDYEAYRQALADKQQAERSEVIDSICDQISDINNPEPIPRDFAMRNPLLAAWLNGEAPSYRPSILEYHVLYPAMVERRRRLKECGYLGALNRVPTGGEYLASSFNEVKLTKEAAGVLRCLVGHAVLLSLDDIEVAAGLSRATAAKAVNELISNGYANRPEGPRKGVGATPEGRLAANLISTNLVQT